LAPLPTLRGGASIADPDGVVIGDRLASLGFPERAGAGGRCLSSRFLYRLALGVNSGFRLGTQPSNFLGRLLSLGSLLTHAADGIGFRGWISHVDHQNFMMK
jgi:hypothetical protein